MAKINLQNLDTLQHEELHSLFGDVLSQLNGSSEAVQEEAKSFVDAVEAFDKAWENSENDDLIAADTAADVSWLDFNDYLGVMINYPVEEVSVAVGEVRSVFDEYDDPTELPYEQEYEELRKLLIDLDAIPADVKEKAMVNPYIEQMRERVAEFNRLYALSLQANSLDSFVNKRDAKSNASRELSALFERVNASLSLNENGELAGFASKFDDLIATPLNRGGIKARKL